MNEDVQRILHLLGEFKEKNGEIIPKYCPFCQGGSHKDTGTFAINKETGAYNCMRGSCKEAGNINKLAEYLGVETKMKNDYFREYRKPKKVYKKPEVQTETLSKKIVEYFELRGISNQTLLKNKVTEKNGNIVFNYYENGEIVFVKYKIPRKPQIVNGKKEAKSWREPETKPVLYGMDDCKIGLPLVIVEGEPDKLVLDECGVKNAVSVPSGTEDINWIELCWDFLSKFDEIIIWADNDVAGKGMQQELLSRLDDWKLRVVETEHKDANVALFKEGKEKVKRLVENAKSVQKEYITNLADVKRKDYRYIKPITTGYVQIDTLLGGMYGGQLCIWTGYNGAGKSTILSNIILNGIEDGEKTFAYSGELTKEEFKEWMDLQLSGKQYLGEHYCEVKKQQLPIPNEKYFHLLDDFYADMMFLYDSDDYATDDEILKAMEYMAKREGVKVFMLDNMLTMKINEAGTLSEKQQHLVKKIKNFARRYNAVVHLVAHPRKPDQQQVRVDKYSISGTANISDLADRVFGFHRLTEAELQSTIIKGKKDQADVEVPSPYEGFDNVLMIMKDRKFGVYNEEILFKFDWFCKRYYTNDKERNKKYSWTGKINKKQDEMEEYYIDEIPF